MSDLPVARIRTSDRIAFKRCRRKWGWSSHMRMNRTEDQARAPLWSGSGFHFAMEDYHGENKYKHPRLAFMAYVDAINQTESKRVPHDVEEQIELICAMCDYYVEWLGNRDALKTFVFEGKQQIEVEFEIPIPIDPDYVRACGYSKVVYQGTLDRVIQDEHDRIWILDYKSAKLFATQHLDTDPQIGAYLWAGSVLYPGQPVTGFVYQQHLKKILEPPKFLASKKSFSTAKNQATTHRIYKNALINLYGSVQAASAGEVEYLNYLATMEDPNYDALIRRDWEYRNEVQIQSEGEKIMLEAMDMINPDLPMYPNPTRDCSFDCTQKMTCVMMDDGSDWEADLMSSTIPRNDEKENWRKFLK